MTSLLELFVNFDKGFRFVYKPVVSSPVSYSSQMNVLYRGPSVNHLIIVLFIKVFF